LIRHLGAPFGTTFPALYYEQSAVYFLFFIVIDVSPKAGGLKLTNMFRIKRIRIIGIDDELAFFLVENINKLIPD
jgi:hypothetical protein